MNAAGVTSLALAGGGDGWLQPNWRRVDYSYSSSSSYISTQGTAYSSTPSTNTSVCFTPLPQSSRGLDLSSRGEQSEKLEHLLQEFCAAKDVSTLDRWLSEVMGVVSRQIAAADPAATSLLYVAWTWIRALSVITESVDYMSAADMLTNTAILEEEEERIVHIYSARFAETCISKMLPFVDALVAPYSCGTTRGCGIVVVSDGAPAPAEKLRALIDVREAVSRATQDIRGNFPYASSSEVKRITDEIASLLLAKEAKLDEAIWSAMEETKTRHLASVEDDDSSWWMSPDIHKVTRAIISFVNILRTNGTLMHRILDQAAQLRGYAPKIDNVSPLTSLIMETVSCLEERLTEKSRSFPDQGFRFLFLINNSYFIRQQLYWTDSTSESHMSDLACRIDDYVESYLQVSWALVLSCLCNSGTFCLGRYPSPAKFEAEFRKTYATQKLWKVPDPQLRRRLRLAAIEKIVPSYTNYLEDNNISPSGITPQDLKDMLQELFEG